MVCYAYRVIYVASSWTQFTILAMWEARIWGTFTYNLNFIIILKTHDFCRVLPSPSIPTPTQADMQVVIRQVQRNCDGKALDEGQVPCCAVLAKWKLHSWLPTYIYTHTCVYLCSTCTYVGYNKRLLTVIESATNYQTREATFLLAGFMII